MNRIRFLDGLRGVLALIVFGEHFIKAFYPTSIAHETTWVSGSLLDLSLVFSPLTLIYNGAFAVSGFFVLSGYVLMRSAWYSPFSTTGMELATKLLRRYLRFALPITLSLLTILVAGHQGWLEYTGFIVENGSLLKPLYTELETLTFSTVVFQGMLTSLFSFNFNHNPVLWVMTPEMLAVLIITSFGYFLNTCIAGRKTKIFTLTVFIVITFLLTNGYLFIGLWIGTLLFGLHKALDKLCRNIKTIPTACLLVGIALVLCDLKGGITNPFVLGRGEIHLSNYIYTLYGMAWGAILFGLFYIKRMQKVFENEILQSIGKASFGIYLFHYPLLAIIAVPIAEASNIDWDMRVTLAGFISLGVAYLVGQYCYSLIERPVMLGKTKFNLAENCSNSPKHLG